jgi:hypothetical protein
VGADIPDRKVFTGNVKHHNWSVSHLHKQPLTLGNLGNRRDLDEFEVFLWGGYIIEHIIPPDRR